MNEFFLICQIEGVSECVCEKACRKKSFGFSKAHMTFAQISVFPLASMFILKNMN